LKKATKDFAVQNTVVLSGLKIKDGSWKTLGEFDFIIVSLPLKSIIQIEAKNGNNEKNINSAEKQLIRGQEFFVENFPFPSSENWTYTKMMCFGESVEEDICDYCKTFVLSANFINSNKIQPVANPIADQFKTFWKSCKSYIGIIIFKRFSFELLCLTKM
jgi:hypothetical protein